METLSERDQCSNQDALRIWRWAAIRKEVERIEGRPRIPEWYEEVAETEWDLEQTWKEFPGLPGSDNDHACLNGWVTQLGKEGIAEIVSRCRTWLEAERSAMQEYAKAL